MISKKEQDSLLNKYGKLNIQEEENPNSKFYVGILDRFNRPLSIEEAENLLISFDPRNKETQNIFIKQETKFLNFFKVAYELNDRKPVYVFCPEFPDLRSESYSTIIKTLDESDKKLLKILKNVENIYGTFKAEDEELLILFAKLSLRELCFSNFFFDNSGSIIIGNYELSFPIYCLHEMSFKSYKKKATELGLFIR